METLPFESRRWTRKEYDRLGELGVFPPGEPVELIASKLIVSEPKGSPHATGVGLTADALRIAFGAGWVVRVQDPVALDEESEPVPDASAPLGWRYAALDVLSPGAMVSPLARPKARIVVADLLP